MASCLTTPVLCYPFAMARKGNVLVVDDEEVMRDVLESLLSGDGYRVDIAKTGEEGLAKLTERTKSGWIC